jgi:hypothetical protein
MGNARSRTEKDDGNGLMGNLIVAWIEITTASSDKAQASVFDFEPTAIKPDQTVAVGVRDASFFKAQASCQH